MTANLLPDLPGYVHGIKALEPPTIQCDRCAETYVYKGRLAMAILTCGMRFNHKRRGDRRRLCRTCADIEWPDLAGDW